MKVAIALSSDSTVGVPSVYRIVTRGMAAAHGALAGAVYLVLLHAPVQVASALAIGLRAGSRFGPGSEPWQVLVSLTLDGTLILFAVAVFFLFPLIQGGVLGQVRDRLESPGQRPSPFRANTRVFYLRLLGSQVIFTLILMVLSLPVVCVGAGLAIQQMPEVMQSPDGGAATPAASPQAKMERRLLSHPVFVGGMVLVTLVASVVGVVYWMATCAVVADGVRAAAALREAVRFCQRNLMAVLAIWLVNLVAGVVVSGLGLLGQLGFVTNPWALAGLAVAYSILIGYWGVILGGLCMSLYLGRRTPADSSEQVDTATVGD